jgi:hypothetical protein
MLKAVIVYLQGTGGNLLSRSLSLAKNTIAYLPEHLAQQQPRLQVCVDEKLKLYNNWDSNDWSATETKLAIWYRRGKQDFYHYQESDLFLIDQFHPVDYENESQQKNLWQSDQDWEHTILITWQEQSLDQIKKLASLKRPDLNHMPRFSKEIAAYHRCLQCHRGTVIAWESMLNENTYLKDLQRLCIELNLQIDMFKVRTLWQSWFKATDNLLNKL